MFDNNGENEFCNQGTKINYYHFISLYHYDSSNIKTTFLQVVFIIYTQKVRVCYHNGAREGNRTLKVFLPSDFESDASTSSATLALLNYYNIIYYKSIKNNIVKYTFFNN